MYISAEQRKVLIIGLSSVILFLLDIFFVMAPLINKILDLNVQIVSIKKNISDLRRQVSMLDSMKQKLEALKLQDADYEKRFPKEEELPSLLESLSAIALKSNVVIVAVKPIRTEIEEQAAKGGCLFKEIPIEIVAKGGYHHLGNFINRLEMLDRFMEIKDIEIGRDETTSRRHNLRLLVSTYILLKA
ncbi:MAG: type 4a pilus biogenesis protein PilO [Candidatus Omnitrophica bacterium]|nr:type 4a pilus biogenesis protein PilO [Candidatus Omnitrophota bacterium]